MGMLAGSRDAAMRIDARRGSWSVIATGGCLYCAIYSPIAEVNRELTSHLWFFSNNPA